MKGLKLTQQQINIMKIKATEKLPNPLYYYSDRISIPIVTEEDDIISKWKEEPKPNPSTFNTTVFILEFRKDPLFGWKFTNIE